VPTSGSLLLSFQQYKYMGTTVTKHDPIHFHYFGVYGYGGMTKQG